MDIETPFQGSLFANDFLRESIVTLPEWETVDDHELNDFKNAILEIFHRFPITQTPNESVTENDLIWPVLAQLGWTESLQQQNLSIHGRQDVPDGLLFEDQANKDLANRFKEEWKRYEFGLAITESKRWARPLDRRSGYLGEETAPSTQILRYLRRVDDLTNGKLRWGLLTNGARWRLYYSGARSVSEQFFEIDLAVVLNLSGQQEDRIDFSESQRHWLKVFMLIFRREAFLPGTVDLLTFHQRAIEESRYYEERVAANLSTLIFNRVFPELVCAIADAAPETPLSEIRDATLILLYRLLFILYAEDRNLLPTRDSRYADYALREKVRDDVGQRKDNDDVFSIRVANYWSVIDNLCRAIDEGDVSIGLPPYNGGLFDQEKTPLLNKIRLGDSIIADIIDALSFEHTKGDRRYINYRDLGVQQLGSIYERLLEYEIVYDGNGIIVRPNIFARKKTGSYYTPDDLVGLIIRETIKPLTRSHMKKFMVRYAELEANSMAENSRIGLLKLTDPATEMLKLKICDPAMGSGHFLVNLVDHLSDQVITAIAEAEALVDNYTSPLTEKVEEIRITIIGHARERGWTIDEDQLDDRHIIRRMILKRCVYGVDKNPMAVELAKVALWLHTFTVGAPLSFLDHHLRCGNSLFGSWVRTGLDKAMDKGGSIFLHGPANRAMRAASPMQIIEGLSDADIAEVYRSVDVFDEVKEMTAPLNAFLSLTHAFDWINPRNQEDQAAYYSYLDGSLGDPIKIAEGEINVQKDGPNSERFTSLFKKAQEIIKEEHFFHWQVAYPGVWSEWENASLSGGFDALIGNPPWSRIKLKQVEWFAARRREIAMAERASDRERLIANLEKAGDPLADDFAKASERAKEAARMARMGSDYPLLSSGDINLYSLFIERAMTLVKPGGMVGLLTPSGIASDKTAAPFFKDVATNGRLRALYDFENRKPFFPDVDRRFKFCVFVASSLPIPDPAQCAFYLQDVSELDEPDRCFSLTSEDFTLVNPNTGTAPIFRSRRDAELTKAIYGRLPVLVDHSSGKEEKIWPVKYKTMFHMTNDSNLFRTRMELDEEEGAWPIGGNRYDSPSGMWVPLYEGKMVQAYDHRAASIVVNRDNQHRPAQTEEATLEQHQNPDWLAEPRFWVLEKETGPLSTPFILGFKHVTSPTNSRSMIAGLIPGVGAGNSLPLLLGQNELMASAITELVANLNSIILDYVVRQKVQGQNLNLFIIEQLPVVPPTHYETICFGPKTVGEIVHQAVLELTYTAQDMAPFASDMGYLDDTGSVRPPFPWDEDRRLHLCAKLDAVFFHLYGITDRDDVRYIYSTFPSIEQDEIQNYSHYRSCDLCLAWMNALAAGNPDAEIN